jgi:hypothetical protein
MWVGVAPRPPGATGIRLHRRRAAVYSVWVKPPRRTSKIDPVLDRLEREGRLRPATADLRDVLARRGSLTGPITDAGTRALQEQRGDRG